MPGLSDTHSRLAYRRSDHADNAIAEVRTALSVDPKNAEAYPFLGSVCTPTASIRPPSMPSRNHWLASRTAPTFTTTWELLSAPGAILTRPQPACRKAIALNPQFWVAHNNLGMLLYDMRRFAEYLKARRLVPEESVVRNNLGNTYCDKGDYAAVIVEFGELFRMDSGWQLGHSCLPGAFLRDSRTQLAILQNPISADEHRYLGQALLLVHR